LSSRKTAGACDIRPPLVLPATTGDTPGMRTPFGRFVATLRATLAWIVPAIVGALTGLVLVRRCVPAGVLEASANAAGNYLQALGTIYAVLLAFVVFVVWQQFNEARANVEREANELIDLARTVKGLPPGVRQPLHAQVERYVALAVGCEWDAMTSRDQTGFEQGARVLDLIWDLLVEYEPSSECHKSLYDEALARFNDLSDTRTMRISSSMLRIPLAMRLLLYSGALMTVASMYLLAVPSAVIHGLMTAAMAGAIAHLLYIIGDLDDPFGGDWQVSRDPFLRVRRHCTAVQPASAETPDVT
jgi:hypothetical protein